MDDADLTAHRAEIEEGLLRRASRKPSGPPPIGECYFCQSPLTSGLRFCDAECRDDYENQQARKKTFGRSGD
jgi:hypothetical protein